MTARLTVRDVALTVPHYVQRERAARSWSSVLLAAATTRMRREYRTLLSDVSFDLSGGDRLALIGRNGAGKTTLLRILSGALHPTQGEVAFEGSRQALLNLSLGFNQEATVKENIFLRATAMGLRPAQAQDLVEPVLDFAELRGVTNHRLATLSSGQRMRLGFAISTSLQHDIMLLDEWFGAGDAEFVERARVRMADRVAGSGIVVLASHNIQMLRQVCTLGLVLDQGRATYFGPLEEAIAAYKESYQQSPEYLAMRDARRGAAQGKDREARAKLREARLRLRQEKAELRAHKQALRALQKQARGRSAAKQDD